MRVTSTKKSILDLVREKVVIFDGAMGTMLLGENLRLEEIAPESWNLEKPEVVRKLYRSYYEAGSDVVQTNTFGANKIRLSEKGLHEKVYDLNYSAAKSLRQACPVGKFVAGNIGPTGSFSSIKSKKQVESVFEEQIKALVDAGVDLLSAETMSSLQEALCILRVAKRLTSLPIFISMNFRRESRGFFTAEGEDVRTCMSILSDFGADIVGANCMDCSDLIEVTWEIRKSTFLPIIVQPNAGLPVITDNKAIYDKTPLEFAQDCLKMVNLGADIIGGCCGTTPEFIRTLCEHLRKSK